MTTLGTYRRRRVALAVFMASGILVAPAWAQRPGAPSTGNSTGIGSGGIGSGTNTRNSNPNLNYPNSNSPAGSNTTGDNGPFANRPIFLSGKVMFDDGTPPNSDIRIEKVCAGNPHLQAHTDSKGRFSLQLDNNGIFDDDPADGSPASPGRQAQTGSSSPNVYGRNNSPYGRQSALWNCELQASYPGYRSDIVELSMRRSLDDPNVGTVILHRLANVKGSTISLTTALAPKRAVKDYEKGSELAQKGRFDEAEKRFEQAVDLYPKYAVAWFALGQIQQRQSKPEDARKSYQAAITADSKYVSPYDQLALLAVQSGKWQEAADFSRQAVELNPVEFPSSFWYNAIANYNLKKDSDAEKSAKQLVKLDTGHHFPQAEGLLAQIYLARREYPEAAVHLKTYLELAPNAQDADSLKRTLSQIEQANAQAKK